MADATWQPASAKETSLSAEAATAGPTLTAATEQTVTAASDSADMSDAQNTEPASSRVNPEAGKTLNKSPQDGSETLNTRDCLATLKNIREQLEEVSTEVAALKEKLIANIREQLEKVSTEVAALKEKLIATTKTVDTLLEKYSRQAAELDDDLKSLQQRNAELEAQTDRLPPQYPVWNLSDHQLWI
ncbi:MAG: hypothetical protein WCQ91_01380, partial [Planctomycetota bacterium]